MTKWLRRVRGAVGMGVAWAAGWAIAGLLIGVSSILLPGLPWDRFFEVFDAPLPALAIPGFFGGVFFSTVLGIAGRRRRFGELSLPRFIAWGAAGGVLLTLFPVALVAVGLASTAGSDTSLWQGLAVVGGPFILLSAASAAGTLLLARKAEGKDSIDFTDDVAATRHDDSKAKELPGGSDWTLHTHPEQDVRDRVPRSSAGDASDV
jgi:hypothetical protein